MIEKLRVCLLGVVLVLWHDAWLMVLNNNEPIAYSEVFVVLSVLISMVSFVLFRSYTYGLALLNKRKWFGKLCNWLFIPFMCLVLPSGIFIFETLDTDSDSSRFPYSEFQVWLILVACFSLLVDNRNVLQKIFLNVGAVRSCLERDVFLTRFPPKHIDDLFGYDVLFVCLFLFSLFIVYTY